MKLLSGVLLSMSLLLAAAIPAQAAYPEKPINMVIAFSAGGSSDVQARIMQKYWNKYCNQPWVFVYKPGAGGMIGFTEIALAKPDGYTIGGLNVPHIVCQSLAQQAKFNVDSYAYICQVVNDPQVVAVRKDSKYKTLKEVFDAAKANPGKIKVGLSSKLSGHHLMFLDVQKKYPDSKFVPIFYNKGAAEQNAALLGGEVDVMFGNLNDVTRALDEMRVLGIASDKESKQLPGVKTMKSQGYDIVSDIRRLFAAPKNIDPKQLATLREIFKKICMDKDYVAEMIKAGQPEEYMSGEELNAWIKTQFAKSEALLKGAGLLKK